MTSLLEIQNLRIHFNTYRGTIEAVRGIYFRINKGEIVGLVGESGCGKSVTAHSILQLLPKEGEIVSGQILLEGENLLTKTQKEMEKIRGRKIGMIFQDPMASLNPTMPVGQQIMEGLLRHELISKKDAYEKSLQLLIKVGIGDASYRMKQYPYEFSGGMRQRVLIAIAIACQPLLIIADEPTTALDVTIQAQILELLREIQQQTGILFITHDLGVVANLCDRVLVMYGGQIVEAGLVDQVFKSPQHPYTQALLKAKESLSFIHQKSPLISIPGSPPSLLNPAKRCLFAPRCPYTMRICTQLEPPLESLTPSKQAACWLYHKNRKAL
jgi:oligopeptide transport system ATP-binding protein